MSEIATLRELLTRWFSAEEIRTIAFDSYPAVYDDLAGGMTKTQTIELLLDHCRRNLKTPGLIERMRRERPHLASQLDQLGQASAAEASQPGGSVAGDLRRRRLEKDLAALQEEHDAVAEARRNTLDPIAGAKLQRQLDAHEQKIAEIRRELGQTT